MSGGTVYSLTPAAFAGGAWTETVLHSFGQRGDGTNPSPSLVLGSGGILYGTTYNGGSGYGTVFHLSPNKPWTEIVLYSFTNTNGDGANPAAPLVMDQNGTLYGTTQYGGAANLGTVFRLAANSSGTWEETVLYSFQGMAAGDGANPICGLLFGENELYGSTYGGGDLLGTLFNVTPPDGTGAWTETLLATFDSFDGANPVGSLIWGDSDALLGTTTYGGAFASGAVFALRPNAQ